MATSNLRYKPVFRNIETSFTVLGIPAVVMGLVIIAAVAVLAAAGTRWGLYTGAVGLALSAMVFNGKDPLWAINGLLVLYLFRRGSVLVAAAPEKAVDGKLDEARKLHEAQ